jgi:hypothetical protein
VRALEVSVLVVPETIEHSSWLVGWRGCAGLARIVARERLLRAQAWSHVAAGVAKAGDWISAEDDAGISFS